MQVWQLFHMIPEYCDITHENASLYCNMVKFLLRIGKIHGTQEVVALKGVPLQEWIKCLKGSCFSTHHAAMFHKLIHNIIEYIEGPRPEKPPKQYTWSLGVTMSLVAGFAVGCICTSYVKK